MALLKRKPGERMKNRYVWRLDFPMLAKEDYHSEIYREVKKHPVFYNNALLILVLCECIFILAAIALFMSHANLVYVELTSAAAILLGAWLVALFMTPRLTGSDLKKIEDELAVQSEAIQEFEFDGIFTEKVLIVQRGIMVYRIPYSEIVQIRLRRTRYYNILCFRLRDGKKLNIIDNRSLRIYATYDSLWERFLDYNPNIVIKVPEEKYFLFHVLCGFYICVILCFALLFFGVMEGKKTNTNITIRGFEIETDLSEKKLVVEDFLNVELGSSLNEIEDILGKPDAWIGSGILQPVYILQDGSAVLLTYKNFGGCEDLSQITYIDKNGKELIIKAGETYEPSLD